MIGNASEQLTECVLQHCLPLNIAENSVGSAEFCKVVKVVV